MKSYRPQQLSLFSLLLVVGVLVQCPADVFAGFHDGGVASCSSCHVMHNSQVSSGGGGGSGGGALLVDGPPSDLCLNCHALEYGAVLSSDPLAPSLERGPGNFGFLRENNLNDGPDGISNPIGGDAAGHNLRAPGYGLSSDGTFSTSPGGSYPANNLKCTSCHDPHGNTNYRMLRGSGMGGMGAFFNPAPVAVGLNLELQTFESNSNHVAYISGMSLWCANCHADYLTNDHQIVGGNFEHPGDGTLGVEILPWYNNYYGTANPTGGNESTAYLAAVPFEDSANTTNRTAGPTVGSQIMCLSCHRAHASSSPHSGRWDFNVATLGQDGVVSGSYPIPNPYLDPDQQSLCFKCHENGEN